MQGPVCPQVRGGWIGLCGLRKGYKDLGLPGGGITGSDLIPGQEEGGKLTALGNGSGN